jgi:hypothetical protein
VFISTTETAFPLLKQNTELATQYACINIPNKDIVRYRLTTYFVNFVHETFFRNKINHSNGHTMAQTASRRVLNVETRIHLHVVLWTKWQWDRRLSKFIPVSVLFHRGLSYWYITWGWTIGPLVAALQRRSPARSTWTSCRPAVSSHVMFKWV